MAQAIKNPEGDDSAISLILAVVLAFFMVGLFYFMFIEESSSQASLAKHGQSPTAKVSTSIPLIKE